MIDYWKFEDLKWLISKKMHVVRIFYLAIGNGNVFLVNYLLSSNILSKGSYHVKDALAQAIMNSDEMMVKLLVEFFLGNYIVLDSNDDLLRKLLGNDINIIQLVEKCSDPEPLVLDSEFINYIIRMS